MTEGSYRSGNSFLHRTDPRVKLLLVLGLAVCLFSATTPQRLLLICCLWFAVAGVSTQVFYDVLRIIKMLRWLLVFTLIVHLFFTPGRTLFGTSWISYDGLVRGLMINTQFVLAVLFSLLLAWTTRPEALAAGLTTLLAPLQRLRVPVKEAGGMLLLVLHFFPLIQAEVAILKAERKENHAGRSGIKGWICHVEPLLTRLFDGADALAREINSGSQLLEQGADREGAKFDRHALMTAVGGLIIILLLWQV
ncbi:energy-coupling factor transport system permease protein [Desulfuromusa kysingii]|uniref:Energy-coupling factor transport system permease protein n=1 Tax=Desulfuromusa kysingii TaxID=37625 RepID=A0A1H3Y959_9BACT|nr:energy-coupling factor transporter transmembrane component T [Desulfuromusa kysingii]SEA08136.1 energy-coupling factor transport system permease protein [Desulfuromusa kysingii]